MPRVAAKTNKKNGHKPVRTESITPPSVEVEIPTPGEESKNDNQYAGLRNMTPGVIPSNAKADAWIGQPIDTGNYGSRILAMDKDLPTMLKALYIDDEEEAINFAAALAWCSRWNRVDSKGNGTLTSHIEALKYRLSLKCSRKGLYTHLYGEFANGLITTDANGRGLQHIVAKGKDEPKERGWKGNQPPQI